MKLIYSSLYKRAPLLVCFTHRMTDQASIHQRKLQEKYQPENVQQHLGKCGLVHLVTAHYVDSLRISYSDSLAIP